MRKGPLGRTTLYKKFKNMLKKSPNTDCLLGAGLWKLNFHETWTFMKVQSAHLNFHESSLNFHEISLNFHESALCKKMPAVEVPCGVEGYY